MELITIKRENKSPDEQLLNLFEETKEPFVAMMSNDYFKRFVVCDRVKKDYYELNDSDYDAYDINESTSYCSKSLLRIEVKFINGLVIVIKAMLKGKRVVDNVVKKVATKIYYLE